MCVLTFLVLAVVLTHPASWCGCRCVPCGPAAVGCSAAAPNLGLSPGLAEAPPDAPII